MKKVDTIVSQLIKFNPQAIILFGSAARGEMTSDSDLDLLIVRETRVGYFDRVREIRSAIKTNTPLDIIVLTPKEAQELPKKSTFFSQIIKEGKVLYGRI